MWPAPAGVQAGSEVTREQVNSTTNPMLCVHNQWTLCAPWQRAAGMCYCSYKQASHEKSTGVMNTLKNANSAVNKSYI